MFLSDKYFMQGCCIVFRMTIRPFFDMDLFEMDGFLALRRKKKRKKLRTPVADSYHLIVASLYQFLLLLNRFYTKHFNLPTALPLNNHAYQYKQLLEKNICRKVRVNDYAEIMGVSRVSLDKAVVWEFGISAAPSAGTAAVAGNKK